MIKKIPLCTIFILILNYVHGNELENRNDKAFSLFNVVKFKNTGCQSSSDPNLQGTCYTTEQCSERGGTADGNCAASFGVCCILKLQTCGSMITQNCSFIENVGYPTAVATAGACAYTVQRCSPDICQVRLDFIDFRMAQPAATGLCNVDTLNVLAGGDTNNAPQICGDNRGQHMYLNAGRMASNVATLNFNTMAAGTGQWRIKVSQIECGSGDRAPDGCLQYFKEPMSRVQSFNFGNGAGDCNTGCNLQSQDYSVCFRKNEGMCAINYTPSTRVVGDSFSLGTNNGNALADTGINGQTGANSGCLGGNNNDNSAIQITNVPLSSSNVHPPAAIELTSDTYCGNFLSGVQKDTKDTVVTQNLKHLFQFRVIALAGAQTTFSGFELDATQVPC